MIVVRFLVGALFMGVVIAGKNDIYAGFSLHGVVIQETSDIIFLHELEASMDLDQWEHGAPGLRDASFMVSPENTQAFLKTLDLNGLDHYLIIEDVAKHLDEFDKNLAQYRTKRGRFGRAAVPFDDYPRYSQINEYLENIAAQYPDLVTLVNVGQSFEGRDIKYIKISISNFTDTSKPIYYMDAMIHAREWVTTPVALYSIHRLVEDLRDEDRDLLEGTDWIIQPLVNPDGYEYTHTHKTPAQISFVYFDNSKSNVKLVSVNRNRDANGQYYANRWQCTSTTSGVIKERLWRRTRRIDPAVNTTCIGIDANRNFDIDFNTIGISSDPCSNTYPGTAPFSDPETRYVRDILFEHLDRIQVYLNIHSQGNWVLFPFGNASLPANALQLHHVGSVMGAAIDAVKLPQAPFYLVGNTALLLYETSGTAHDYGQSIGVPFSYTLELPGLGFGHAVLPDYIAQINEETWRGIAAQARVAKLHYDQRIQNLAK